MDTLSDKDYFKYNIAIHKAINKDECPVKQKHVRSAIIGTFAQQGAQIFWFIALKLPCMDDRIVAWKFCHVLHKIMREGHPLCIEHSQKHRKYLEDLGNLWGHLEEGYGKLIKQYTQLLIAKLDFHRKNPRFPGNLNVTIEDLTNICGNNPDICFQLSVEIFDYLDTILDLQLTVFQPRANSMTVAGQCRLAPIIPCIQDASRLYDLNVKILFILYSQVPYDVLEGHRERFMKQFKLLKDFYHNTTVLQYFKNLISVPPLPENPPNFQASFTTYVTQEVFVPSEEEEPTEGNLIDTSEPPTPPQPHPPPQPVMETRTAPPVDLDLLQERDNIIKNLRENCDLLRTEVNTLCESSRCEKHKLQEQIEDLTMKLALKESELEEKIETERILINNTLLEEEQKSKEEKFKASYFKIREEHITLLREKAKLEKNTKAMEAKLKELEDYKSTIDEKFKEEESTHHLTKTELEQMRTQKNAEFLHLANQKKEFEDELRKIQNDIQHANDDKTKAELELNNSIQRTEELDAKVNELLNSIVGKDKLIDKLHSENAQQVEQIFQTALQENENIMQNAIDDVDNPALSAITCSPDYLCSLTTSCQESLNAASNIQLSELHTIIKVANRIAHKHAIFIIQGRATSNTSPDISFGEKMADKCKILGESVLNLLACLKEKKGTQEAIDISLSHLTNVATLAETISSSVKGETAESLENLLESEMVAMDKAIEEAAKKIQDMLSKSREADTGIKLQVNERILDSCTNLMQAIKVLVEKAKLLQGEIVIQGKGTSGEKEFYKRNHRWTDGFISAAKAVAVAAKFLLGSADKVVGGEGKLEQLVVAAHEISASTAQLVMASRVKANKNSTNLQALSSASKGVTNATGAVVATVKDCSEMIEVTTELDISNLTVHQTKRLEMEAQVKVLELEKDLVQERVRLSALRRHHYQLAGEEEGWVNIEK